MKKFLFICIFIISTFSLVFADEFVLIIEDDANLLTEDQEQNLRNSMTPLTEFGNIIFKSISYNSTTPASYARSYYNNKFGNQSGTVFLIDMSQRYLYIFSNGRNYGIITTSKANIITDNVYRYAKNADYYTCATETFRQIYTLLDGGKIFEPMRHMSNGVIALVFSFLAVYLYIMKVSNIKVAPAKDVVSGCDASIKLSNIDVLHMGQRRIYSPPSSSSRRWRWWPVAVAGGGGRWRWPVAVTVSKPY